MIGILMPTMDRPAFLSRALNFYDRQYTEGIQVYVGDATQETNSSLLIAELHGARYVDCRDLYHEPSGTSHFGCQLLRLAKAAEADGCEYMIHTGDDDFILPDGLRKARALLESDPEIGYAIGERYSFRLHDRGHIGKLADCRLVDMPKTFDDDIPVRRVAAWFSKPYSLQFALARKEVFLAAHEHQNPDFCWYLGNELLVNVLMSYGSKAGYTPEPLVLFQQNFDKPFGWQSWSMLDLMCDERFPGTLGEIRGIIQDVLGTDFTDVEQWLRDQLGLFVRNPKQGVTPRDLDDHVVWPPFIPDSIKVILRSEVLI